MIEIKDSGKRQEFETGAVRDIQEGKGRCDLMPLEIVNKILLCGTKRDFCLQNINNFIHTNKCIYLYEALLEFIDF